MKEADCQAFGCEPPKHRTRIQSPIETHMVDERNLAPPMIKPPVASNAKTSHPLFEFDIDEHLGGARLPPFVHMVSAEVPKAEHWARGLLQTTMQAWCKILPIHRRV